MRSERATLRRRVRRRFRKIWEGATEDQRRRGENWYREASWSMWGISWRTGVKHVKVCGVVAALSPSVEWERNRREAERMCKAWGPYGGRRGEEISITTYRSQRAKAEQILELTEDERLLERVLESLGRRAFKTKAFCQAIARPGRWVPGQMVVIDRHMIRASGWEGTLWITRGHYEMLSQEVERLGMKVGVRPDAVQATIWLSSKENE